MSRKSYVLLILRFLFNFDMRMRLFLIKLYFLVENLLTNCTFDIIDCRRKPNK